MAKQADVKPEQTGTEPSAPTSVEHTAPADQYTSGGQRREQEQQLKKSVKQQQAPRVEEAAGQHRTGSFTGTTGGDSAASGSASGKK
jgi:hypothetical protein